jgi:GTP cyclohydrolase IA
MNTDKIEKLISELIVEIGEDPKREGLIDTPRRVAKFWKEFIDYDAGKTATIFSSDNTDQLVVVSGMRVWSLCEHHLMPFWCDISIGYIANGQVIGLSKLARIAHKHAHKLQIQERLVSDISNEIKEVTTSNDVAVISSGEHTCMTMRGIKTTGLMKSSAMSGMFLDNPHLRAEFMAIAK